MPENTPVLDCLTDMTAISIAEAASKPANTCWRGWPRSSRSARQMPPIS